MAKSRNLQAGFTFMELLVSAAVLMILLTVALPAYDNYSDRADQQRAIADIAEMSLKLTRWELNNRRLPENLAEAGLDGERDPWGNPYEYLRLEDAIPGNIRKDRNLHWINSDYDLYSRGPDGKSSSPINSEISRDDIIRANNGSFLDVAGDFE